MIMLSSSSQNTYSAPLCISDNHYLRLFSLDLFINLVNSFHPALKYTWEIYKNSLPFLDIKLSINDKGLSTSVHYKPTDSHNYLLYIRPLIHIT